LLTDKANKGLKYAKKTGRDRVCITKMFDSIESGKTINDDFFQEVIVISKNKDYKNIEILKNKFVLIDKFDEEKVKYCDCVIFDISNTENLDFEFINKFNDGNRISRSEKHIGVISSNTQDKIICEEKGYEYFPMPLSAKDVEKWLEHI
jgi:hypothetical protein